MDQTFPNMKKSQTHRGSKWNSCGEIGRKKIRFWKSRQIDNKFPIVYSMFIPSAVLLRILGVALREYWTMLFEFSTCKSSAHALRMVLGNGFNEITHSTNNCKIILERKSVCHGFVAAGVFKRFGFEASNGDWVFFADVESREVKLLMFFAVFDGFSSVLPWEIGCQECTKTKSLLQSDHLHAIGSSHMLLPVPHLLFLGPTPIAASLGCRRFLKKDKRNFLKRPKPSTMTLHDFWRFGRHGLLPKMEKNIPCFNWGCRDARQILGVPSCSSLTDLNHIPVFFSWSLISTHHPITTNIVPTYQHSSRFGVIVSSLRLKEHEHNDTVYIVVWEWVELSYVDVFSSWEFQLFFYKKRLDKRRLIKCS